jgi:hypothetical protein
MLALGRQDGVKGKKLPPLRFVVQFADPWPVRHLAAHPGRKLGIARTGAHGTEPAKPRGDRAARRAAARKKPAVAETKAAVVETEAAVVETKGGE